MSRFGRLRPRQKTTLFEGAQALERSSQLASGRLPGDATREAAEVLAKIRGRRIQDMSHTVVVFAGATGSGKSSLFNAILGKDVARVAPTRPTTSEALGATAGENGPLLDWLGIKQRVDLPNAPVLEGGATILVDLPDIDSTEATNRQVAQDLIARADAVVWVVDPQKYADGVLHLEFLQTLREHAGGMLVVLNQIDRLEPADQRRVPDHLRTLLSEGGLRSDVAVSSAVTGEGVEELRGRIRALAASKHAAAMRLAADLRTQAALFARDVEADGGVLESPVAPADFGEVSDALTQALGAGVVVRAAQESYVHRGVKATGWIWTKWLRSLRADPLKRLHLAAPSGGPAALPASSLVLSPAQRSVARAAVRRYSQDSTANLPQTWRHQVVSQSERASGDLLDTSDNLFMKAQPHLARRPRWWSLALALQWLCALAAMAGLAWLAVYWIADWFKVRLPEPPYWGPLAVPTVLVAGGLVVGWLLAVLARFLLRVGSRRLANSARDILRAGIAEIAELKVIDPLEENLGQYGDFVQDVSVMAAVK